jgi:hypothetical protein
VLSGGFGVSQVCLSGFGWLLGFVTGVCRVVADGFGCRRFRSTRLGPCLSWAMGEGAAGPDLVFFGPVLRYLGGWPVWGVFLTPATFWQGGGDKELWFGGCLWSFGGC